VRARLDNRQVHPRNIDARHAADEAACENLAPLTTRSDRLVTTDKVWILQLDAGGYEVSININRTAFVRCPNFA
jgi:hypothetical protein